MERSERAAFVDVDRFQLKRVTTSKNLDLPYDNRLMSGSGARKCTNRYRHRFGPGHR